MRISGPNNKEALVQILGLIRIRIYCVEILYLIKCHIFSGDGIFNLWGNYRVFHVIGHQENCSYEHDFLLMGFLKVSMEPQDQAQITFRSEIHSIVFSVGQEGDCLEERISRSGDFSTRYSVSQKRFLPSVMKFDSHMLHFITFD